MENALWQNKKSPCMYFGHTFDYELDSDVKELKCYEEFDDQIDLVDITLVQDNF